ncbi:MAG TPA: hypothetical protein VHL11_02025, partial [Phototrophicaceae bacterium]|nr:hypothetical protein [Phototrophicaceae bacterium]
ACILDKLLLTPPHTFYPYFAYFPGQLLWLPDHSAISYIDYLDFDSSPTPIFQDFFVLNTDGSQRRQVTNGNDVYWADWSPDGQRLLLSQSINGRGEPQIWTMKIDGNAYGALTSGDHRKVWGGWLADSESVIYVENIGEFKNQIGPTEQEFIFYTVNVTSGGLKELYRTNEEVTDTQLAPDRSKVVISSWELTPIEGSKYFDYTGFNTILLDVITGETTPLPKACYNPLWLPDSSGIICLDDVYDDNAITVTRLEDLTPEVIELEHPLSDTDRGFTWDMGWLPDGRLLMLTTGNSVLSTDADQLLAVNLSDGTITTVIGAVGEED